VKVWNMDWDAKTHTEFRTLKGHRGYVLKVAFSPDGRRLASGSGYTGHGEILVWDSELWDKARGGRPIAFNTALK
jgi:WD40 repeat protein